MTNVGPGRIEKFDSKNLKVVRDRFTALLDQHGFEGVDVQFGDITFTDGDAHMTIIARIEGGKTREYRVLERAAQAFDLDLERVVRGMRLVGYVPRRRGYPFIVEDQEGDRYKMTTSAAVRVYSRESATVEEVIRETAIQRHSLELDGSLPSLV